MHTKDIDDILGQFRAVIEFMMDEIILPFIADYPVMMAYRAIAIAL